MVRIRRQSDKKFLLDSCSSQLDGDGGGPLQDNASFQLHGSGDVGPQTTYEISDFTFVDNTPQVTKKIKQLISYDPVDSETVTLLRECESSIRSNSSAELREFVEIYHKNPHLSQLLVVHDDIAHLKAYYRDQISAVLKTFEAYYNGGHDGDDDNDCIDASMGKMPGQTVKMVGLRKSPNEPLGLTVELDDHNQLMVARILSGGVIDKQGLLHPGDVILEVNGVPVTTPEELQMQVSHMKTDSLTLKIGPSVEQEMKSARLTADSKLKQNLEPGKKMTCYMRAQFDYDPTLDQLLPCQDIGLSFKRGDILQIINVKDPNWWQARHAGTDGPTGLVPSQELEERRQAYVPPEADYVHKISICGTRISKKKRKHMYKTKSCNEFDKAEMVLYEEVTKMPPFRRKTLVLVGVQGVGRRTLKNRLINSDPQKFGTIIPHTTRPPRALEENGQTYWFVDRETMDEEIRVNNMLEYGEHNGNVYGTHLDSIRSVIQQGKMCVLDCAPNSLKMLHQSQEFLPYVVFIAAPGMEQLKQIYAERRATGGSQRNLAFDRQSSIRYSSRRARTLESLASLYEDDDLVSTVEESALLQRKYENYIDMVIVNEDPDMTFHLVIQALDNLAHQEQFVPVNWIY